jgi:23S rRNA pseudouridine2605 synthase
MAEERLHKILAHAGRGSRRQCEALMAAGRVTVDGRVVTDLGHKADPAVARIECDGERVEPETPVYYLLNKPPGVVCTSSAQETRARAVDLIGRDHRRLYTVGRLDADSRGLIILTNDGTLTQQLTHPSCHVPKTYRVRVRGRMTPETLARVQKGVFLSEGRASLSRVRVVRRVRGGTEIEVQLTQGINRQIRRVLAKVGHPVSDLQRIAVGAIRDPALREGAHRRLREEEVRELLHPARPPASRSRPR